MLGAPSTSLVGRERELRMIRAALERAPAAGTVLVISGEPGTGKSALLEDAGDYGNARGMMVLRATGVQTEARMPLAGLHQLLRPLLTRLDALDDGQQAVLRGAFGATERPPQAYQVGLASLDLLSEVAATQPVLVLVDDAHLIDPATLEVLSFVGRRLDADPIVVLLCQRARFGDVVDVPGVPELELGRLDAESAAALLDDRFPDLRPERRERVLELAAGNPLALLELPVSFTTYLRELGGDIPLTRRLERSFADRVRELPPLTQRLLLVLALDEQLSTNEVLSSTAKLLDTSVTLEALAPAESHRLVRVEGETVMFGHPLMSSAVRQAATSGQRYAAHAAIADTLSRDRDRSVWHRAASALGPDEAIAVQLEATATNLLSRDGNLAMKALSRAAELSSTPVRKGRRLVGAAESALQLGDDQEATRLLDSAESLQLDSKTRHALLWLREALKESSGTATVGSMLGIADYLISEGEVRLGLQALFTAAVRCYMFKTDPSLAAAVAANADRVGLPRCDPSVAAIHALAQPAARRNDVVGRVVSVTPPQIARSSTDRASAAEAAHLYALALTCIGEFQMGVVFQQAAISDFRIQGRLGLLTRALGSHAVVQLALGEWRSATQAADECLRLAGYVRGYPETAADGERILNAGSCLLVLGTVAANRGLFDEAVELIEESDHVHGGIGSNYCLALLQASRGSLALAAGRPKEAFEHLHRVLDPTDAASHIAVSRWATIVRDFADAALASGQAEAAATYLRPLEQEASTAEHRATAAYANAVVSTGEYESRYQSALALTPTSVYFQARLQLAYGIRLRRERRVVDARIHLRTACEGFEAIGAEPWAGRARQELRASGESIPHRTPERRDDLSPQEAQIAQLAAEGLTNREIAARLFVSHRTVGAHLYRIFPKLGITSRGQLRDALRASPPRG